MPTATERFRRNVTALQRSLPPPQLAVALGTLLLMTDQVFAQYNPQYSPNVFTSGHATLPTLGEVTGRFLLDAVAAVVGFLVGAFFSPLLRPFRRIVFFVTIVAVTLYAWLGYAPVAEFLTRIVSVFAFFVALGYGLRLGASSYWEAQREAERPTSFGSAQWATQDHINENGLLTGKGFLLGSFVENGNRMPIHYAGPRHLLTVAPTRSGKGVSSIIPNLLTYEGSAFVIDPKGENSLVTAHRRGSGDVAGGIPGLGQKIYLLDPWDIAASKLGMTAAHFNPLDWIRADDDDAEENAFLLAEALIPSGAGGDARFWDEESKALLCGIILFVATAESEAEHRHLGRVRDILLLNETGFKAVIETMSKEPNRLVKGLASRTAAKDPKLRSNTFAAAQSHTHFLDSPRVRESLSRSDFSFEDLKNTPMTVYLILPADRLESFGRWLRVLIQQAITINARNISVIPAKPVLFLLDEMAALGRLTMIEQAFGLMAGFGIQLWGIVQDLSQLERIYDKGWQTFISNSGVIQYFGSRDKITAEYFSTLCGVTTIRISNLSYTIGKAFSRTWTTVTGANGNNSYSESVSDNRSDTVASNESQRQLAYPDELMVLKQNQQIIFVENLDPIRAEKLRWYDDQSLQRLGVNLRTVHIPGPAASEKKKPRPLPDLKPRQAAAPEAVVLPTAEPVQQEAPVISASEPTQEEPVYAKPAPVNQKSYSDPDFGQITIKIYADKTAELETIAESSMYSSLAELLENLEKTRAELRAGR